MRRARGGERAGGVSGESSEYEVAAFELELFCRRDEDEDEGGVPLDGGGVTVRRRGELERTMGSRVRATCWEDAPTATAAGRVRGERFADPSEDVSVRASLKRWETAAQSSWRMYWVYSACDGARPVWTMSGVLRATRRGTYSSQASHGCRWRRGRGAWRARDGNRPTEQTVSMRHTRGGEQLLAPCSSHTR